MSLWTADSVGACGRADSTQWTADGLCSVGSAATGVLLSVPPYLVGAGNRPSPYFELYSYVGSKRTFAIDWTRLLSLENLWTPDADFAAGAKVRPTEATGFEYVTGAAGHSAGEEPAWPASAGDTVADGGITWTCAAASTGSLITTVEAVAATPPDGIQISNAVVAGQVWTFALATSGAAAPDDYDVALSVTLANGDTAQAVLRVKVR